MWAHRLSACSGMVCARTIRVGPSLFFQETRRAEPNSRPWPSPPTHPSPTGATRGSGPCPVRDLGWGTDTAPIRAVLVFNDPPGEAWYQVGWPDVLTHAGLAGAAAAHTFCCWHASKTAAASVLMVNPGSMQSEARCRTHPTLVSCRSNVDNGQTARRTCSWCMTSSHRTACR